MSPEKLRGHAIQQHLAGNIVAAEKGYKELINRGINDPDILSNLALICQEANKVEKALLLYEKCITLFPNHSFANSNLGYLYLSIGRLEDAEKTIYRAIKSDPKIANPYSTLGLILKEKGDLEEAENVTRKAIKLEPNFINAYINLGLILKDKGNLKEAEIATKQAIDLDPNSADCYLNLGSILQDQGDLKEAEVQTRKAISLKKDICDAHINLAAILKELGRIEEAIICVNKEIDFFPEKQESYLLLNSLLKEADITNLPKAEIKSILKQLLNRNDIDHINLFKLINMLIPQVVLLEMSESRNDILHSNAINHLIGQKEFIDSLKLFTFNTIIWEIVLTKLRKEICMQINKGKTRVSSKFLDFTIALAQQCFLNEYIFNCSNEEYEYINLIENSLSISEADEIKIAILSCYKPLFDLTSRRIKLLSYKSKSESFNNLVKMQLKEPIEEKEIARSIHTFGSIKDIVSKKVKTQYEENPYPRWRYGTHLNKNKLSIPSAVNNEIRPNKVSSFNIKQNCNVLIAGCGTGQQILEADRYKNAKITAIDLSSSSISYAQRKANEYGIKNIKFIQMDILELCNFNESFDVIECCGVLHHMQSPKDGLSALLKVLSDDGFLKLGLYSQLAREDIIKARKIISNKDISATDKGIREFRHKLINGEFPEIKELHLWSDFYTTSMCRDLCFHVQEHRYSLSQIAEILNSFNLNFLGFLLDYSTKEKYANEYKNDYSQIDLKNWIKFEEQNPRIFRAMYQFWVNHDKCN